MNIGLMFLFLANISIVVCQNPEIELNDDFQLYVNGTKFSAGTLSLMRFSDAVEQSSKTKRIKAPYVRYYNYVFKKIGVTLQSSDFEEPSDKCRALIICFRKKKRQVFKGRFKLFNRNINWQTNFDDIFYDQKFVNFIDYSIYEDKSNPRKTWIFLRFKGYSIKMKFDKESQRVLEININSFRYDPNYKEIKSL